MRPAAAAALVLLIAGRPAAQALEPKAYAASPTGANFLILGLSRSSGSIVFDPTLPITDAEATINGVAVGYGATFGLFGKLALVSAVLPVAWGDISGRVGEDAHAISRSGLADSRFKLSMNLRGNDAKPLREFVKTPRRSIVGASV